jgi:glycosyltransferase involved in cell wall biosynthesis
MNTKRMRVLQLAKFMKRGFGVSVVVGELCRRLEARGILCIVGCEGADDIQGGDSNIFILKPDPNAIAELAEKESVDLIIAHTTPFFECLPNLARRWPCFVWEHGDPDPEFFPDALEERRAIVRNKQLNVYPFVSGVIAISEFVRSQIDWGEAVVIPNGWEHAWHGAKPICKPIARSEGELICLVGLFRLGTGEAQYKGNEIFVDLVRRLRTSNVPLKVRFAGRGLETYTAAFEKLGIETRFNIDDIERTRFYRESQIFFSPSLWEGCNLPLMEAQANGALGLVLDTGAHPEYSPFTMRSLADVERLIVACVFLPKVLDRLRNISFSYVTRRFSWDRSVDQFLGLLYSKSGGSG